MLAFKNFGWATWSFAGDEVVQGRYVFGIPVGAKARFATCLLGSVKLSTLRHAASTCYEPTFVGLEVEAGEPYPPGFSYRLDFVGRDGKTLDTIAAITSSETLWLLRELSACLKGMLNRSETTLTLPPSPADSLWDRKYDR